MIWHAIIFSICIGALISGFILTILLSIMAASNFSDQEAGDNDISDDIDGDVDSDIDLEVDAEINVDLETDMDLDSEIDIESEIESDIEIDDDIETGASIESVLSMEESDFINFENQTPLSLVFSLYLLWFGAIGTFTYNLFSISWMWLWLAIILIAPIVFVKIISKFWRRISQNSAYRVRVGNQLLGREATVKIPVSSDGGIVSIKSAGAVQQIGVKSLHELSWFHSGTTVYICEFREGMYFVDDNPASVKLGHLKKQNRKIEISTIYK